VNHRGLPSDRARNGHTGAAALVCPSPGLDDRESEKTAAKADNDSVLFVFDPWRSAILLIAGDKAAQWKTWYERAIPQAEELYPVYLKERVSAIGVKTVRAERPEV
jgi:Phage derived protein Gp49-like (DUF891)